MLVPFSYHFQPELLVPMAVLYVYSSCTLGRIGFLGCILSSADPFRRSVRGERREKSFQRFGSDKLCVHEAAAPEGFSN